MTSRRSFTKASLLALSSVLLPGCGGGSDDSMASLDASPDDDTPAPGGRIYSYETVGTGGLGASNEEEFRLEAYGLGSKGFRFMAVIAGVGDTPNVGGGVFVKDHAQAPNSFHNYHPYDGEPIALIDELNVMGSMGFRHVVRGLQRPRIYVKHFGAEGLYSYRVSAMPAQGEAFFNELNKHGLEGYRYVATFPEVGSVYVVDHFHPAAYRYVRGDMNKALLDDFNAQGASGYRYRGEYPELGRVYMQVAGEPEATFRYKAIAGSVPAQWMDEFNAQGARGRRFFGNFSDVGNVYVQDTSKVSAMEGVVPYLE